MEVLALLAASLMGFVPFSPQFPLRQEEMSRHRVVEVGWNDEMDSRSHWSALNMENKAFVAAPTKGVLFLGLDQAPSNWPYQFQWSGLSQAAWVDIAQFPILIARVTQVQGYAHLDIDVLGPKGEVLNTLRSTTLKSAGLSTIDLSTVLAPKQHRLRIRIIVGGENQGCCATYDWVRFVSKADSDFLQRNPGWNYVRRYGLMYR